jgi:ribosomal protein L2
MTALIQLCMRAVAVHSRPATMLQPRIPSLKACRTFQCLKTRAIVQRSYATAVETTTTSSLPPTSPPKGGLALRTYKPRTPGLRHLIRPINDHLWKGRAYLPLTFPRKGHGIGGRNNTGRVMMRHRGGGHKRRIRIVDFKRLAPGPHTVERIEHDPGRSAHIALIHRNETKEKSYIVASDGMKAGDVIQSYRAGIPAELLKSMGGVLDPAMIAAKTAWKGNCLPLHMIPPGTFVFNIGLRRGQGGQLCRSAGTFGQVLSTSNQVQDGKRNIYVQVKLQSGEVRNIHREACATIGVASNVNYHRRQLGKAGRSRWLGIRPTVRGLAMNAMDHPHGGGRGKSKGNVHPIDVWGRTPVRHSPELNILQPCGTYNSCANSTR